MTFAQPMTSAGPGPRPEAARPPGRVAALDGLRGIAIIAVLLFHLELFDGGFLGVDLFFALSGYLITELLLRERSRTGRISLTRFWERRIARLLPAFTVMLLVVSIAVGVSGSRDLIVSTASDGPWAAANLLNWHLIDDSFGYWDRFGVPRVFEHLWSISVEEQFYLVWPLLVVTATAVPRRAPALVLGSAITLSCLSVVAMIALADPADPTRVYMGTDTRAFSLLLGAAAATGPVQSLLSGVAGWSRMLLMIGAAAAIGGMWLSAHGTGSSWLFAGGLPAHSLLCALLIGLVARGPRTIVCRLLGWRPLGWVGRLSYSLYLWHWPVITLLSPARTGLPAIPTVALVLAVSTAAAGLSLTLVEDPIRFRLKGRAAHCTLIGLALVVAAIVAAWLLLPAPTAPLVDVDAL